MININIHNGLILFNCYLDLCVDLTCPMTPGALMFIFKVTSFMISKTLELCLESISDLCLQTSIQNSWILTFKPKRNSFTLD